MNDVAPVPSNPPSRSIRKTEPPPHLASSTSSVRSSSAKANLEASRARLRTELVAIAHPPLRPSSGLGDTLSHWVREVPALNIAIDAATGWWREHRGVSEGAGQAAQAFVIPIARRNPLGLAAGAIGAGALLILLKPWRLLFRRQVLFAIASVVATRAFRARTLESWVQLAMRFISSHRRAQFAPSPHSFSSKERHV